MRKVLITGGTSGIGAATAKAFKQAGYSVAVNYVHNEETASIFYKETRIPVFKWDVADTDACVQGVKQVVKEIGPIEILVNNAGITRDRMMHKMAPEDWFAVINTNLGGCYNMCRAVIGSMRERQFGRIVNISSVNAQTGQIGQTNYCAAKSGIFGFTKALALESIAKGITVNAVAPGHIDTPMVAKVPEDILNKIIEHVPIKRLGLPREIARVIVFLAADETGFITGETIDINGGAYMQ